MQVIISSNLIDHALILLHALPRPRDAAAPLPPPARAARRRIRPSRDGHTQSLRRGSQEKRPLKARFSTRPLFGTYRGAGPAAARGSRRAVTNPVACVRAGGAISSRARADGSGGGTRARRESRRTRGEAAGWVVGFLGQLVLGCAAWRQLYRTR